ncbi:MAG: radical SAM protein [Anaerotruncus sp.]|nr:radical SAM protein [Anaerotruncus sp.]
MIYFEDNKYQFVELFNDETGTLVRSNVLDHGIETNQLPLMRSFPELIDIGIMGSCNAGRSGLCKNAGVDCYQCGMLSHEKNMSLDDYFSIITQCRGKTFQIALGGAGDPNKHEAFAEILRITRENKIVPNYTTSGYELTDREIELTKKYCGAVAVSFYSNLDKYGNEDNPPTITAIERFIKAECITNIHFVLSKKSIKEAVYRVRNGIFPEGINAVVFLLYKPVGLASRDYVLDCDDSDYLELLHLVTSVECNWRYGFDTCQSPAIYKFASGIAMESIEFCEAARFSMYINSRCIAFPCSFGIEDDTFSVDLKQHTLHEAWTSERFAKFRKQQADGCSNCDVSICRGCGLGLELNLCRESKKDL